MRLHPPTVVSTTETVCAIDPGTNRLGFAVLTFDTKTLSICQLTAQTFRSEHLVLPCPYTTTLHGERYVKILAQQQELFRQLTHYHPDAVCCESAFYNPSRPNAFAALTELLFAIKTLCFQYDPYLPLLFYEPSTIKKAIGMLHAHKKEGVKPALQQHLEIQTTVVPSLEQLDDHAQDAVAVAYTYLLTRRGVEWSH